MTKVAMNLTSQELALVQTLRKNLKISTNTGVIGQSLRIANLIVQCIKNGKQPVLLNQQGRLVGVITL